MKFTIVISALKNETCFNLCKRNPWLFVHSHDSKQYFHLIQYRQTTLLGEGSTGPQDKKYLRHNERERNRNCDTKHVLIFNFVLFLFYGKLSSIYHTPVVKQATLQSQIFQNNHLLSNIINHGHVYAKVLILYELCTIKLSTCRRCFQNNIRKIPVLHGFNIIQLVMILFVCPILRVKPDRKSLVYFGELPVQKARV